jgi:hypothetical protein
MSGEMIEDNPPEGYAPKGGWAPFRPGLVWKPAQFGPVWFWPISLIFCFFSSSCLTFHFPQEVQLNFIQLSSAYYHGEDRREFSCFFFRASSGPARSPGGFRFPGSPSSCFNQALLARPIMGAALRSPISVPGPDSGRPPLPPHPQRLSHVQPCGATSPVGLG